ncbi:sulfotransferase family protein [Aestuariibius insulae]|uniref:sulfotransferase family protein n=1 Tax=Aestuariibius insulae TaxID=2058287 RepID=UPI00345EC85B
MPLSIICPGMGRTGTESLRLALIELGFGPCHHMVEIRARADLIDPWRAIQDGAEPDWPAIFEDFQSQADWPGATYWREITAAFPEAKVILSLRDADSWYKSLTKTILPFVAQKGQHSPPHRNDIAQWCETMFDRVFDGRVHDPDHAKSVFEAHNAAIIDEIPPERLLVYPVGSGWEPLCTFLKVPVPTTPYPSGNTTEDFNKRIAENLID